jgi:tetratricopeptide (TPR) repeat protein
MLAASIEVYMINKDNGFDLNIRWRFPGGREYVFAFIALFVFLIVIYANSFQGQLVFDDTPNIVENKNIFLKTLQWPDIKKTFYDQNNNISRPFAYFSFALNYYFDRLNVVGYHVVNFIIHYLSSVFLFLFIYNTLKLPTVRERYGPASYSIALLAAVFWATSPLQVTAVTYIVQRMASMAGLFYIMAMYFYLKGRRVDRLWKYVLYGGLCVFSAALCFGVKENALMLPVSIWLYDLLLIQGATRKNIIKNLKLFLPVILIIAAVGLWYVDISSILSGAAYEKRPFTLTERLLTQPRVVIFYITLLLYPLSSRLTLVHDIELSTSLLTPWSTLPAIAGIIMLLVLAGYIARKRPLIAFCILFFFLNHVIESSFIPLELIFEHRNYIPSMFFFVPIVIFILQVIDYFSYKKVVQLTMVAVLTFLLSAQGHTVFARNALFANPILLWTDNVEKAPNLSRPYKNLGSAYGNLGFRDKAYVLYSRALSLDRYTNLLNRAINLQNLGLYHLNVTGEYDRALGLFKSALEVSPGYGPAYHGAAVCFIRKGDLTEAESRLMAALSIWPDSANLRNAQGFVLLKMGKYDQSVKEAQQALLLNPDLSDALCILGEASRRKGNYGLATLYWQSYIEKNPNDLQGNLALIELYARQNKKDNLSRTIGKMMVLKGSKSWHELINQLVRDSNRMVYIPDPEAMISIIRGNLDDQLRR